MSIGTRNVSTNGTNVVFPGGAAVTADPASAIATIATAIPLETLKLIGPSSFSIRHGRSLLGNHASRLAKEQLGEQRREPIAQLRLREKRIRPGRLGLFLDRAALVDAEHD